MIDHSLGLHVEREKKTRKEAGVWDERSTQGEWMTTTGIEA
jgi:hypothetical protein